MGYKTIFFLLGGRGNPELF